MTHIVRWNLDNRMTRLAALPNSPLLDESRRLRRRAAVRCSLRCAPVLALNACDAPLTQRGHPRGLLATVAPLL
jgi:hypothetical protein